MFELDEHVMYEGKIISGGKYKLILSPFSTGVLGINISLY
jgi:hypothetical protein